MKTSHHLYPQEHQIPEKVGAEEAKDQGGQKRVNVQEKIHQKRAVRKILQKRKKRRNLRSQRKNQRRKRKKAMEMINNRLSQKNQKVVPMVI